MTKRLTILAIFCGLITGATLVKVDSEERGYVESVSSFICPAKNGDESGRISLGQKGVRTSIINKKNRPFKKSKDRSISLGGSAVSISGDSPSPIVLASKAKTWLGVSQCGAVAGEYWFVGGAADVTSLGYFQFTNGNLGKAIIDIELWSEDGSESTRTLTIPPQSTKQFSLTTFMPGKKQTVFHIISRSGLVRAELFDERRKGLQNFGGDYVAPAAFPEKVLHIAGIPTSKFVKKSTFSSQKLRIFAPGESDAIIQVNYISPSGVFSPIGLDSVRVPAQKVVELALGNYPSSKLFSIEVRSSEPIVAGVLTRGKFSGSQELLWSSSSQELVAANNAGGSNQENPGIPEKFALAETKGYLSIVTDNPNVTFSVIGERGKQSKVSINVDSMAIWKIPATARQLIFTPGAQPSYLALTIHNSLGIASTSLAPALSKELTALPILDSRLYIPNQS